MLVYIIVIAWILSMTFNFHQIIISWITLITIGFCVTVYFRSKHIHDNYYYYKNLYEYNIHMTDEQLMFIKSGIRDINASILEYKKINSIWVYSGVKDLDTLTIYK